MDDTPLCPICRSKLKNTKRYSFLYATNKEGMYVERVCNGLNHSLQFYFDENTDNVDFLKVSLTPVYSRWVEIDFYNKKSRIIYYTNSERQYINLPERVLDPDFPMLTELKAKVSLYMLLL